MSSCGIRWFADESLVLDRRASLGRRAFTADCRGRFGDAYRAAGRLFAADGCEGDEALRALPRVCCCVGGEFAEAFAPLRGGSISPE